MSGHTQYSIQSTAGAVPIRNEKGTQNIDSSTRNTLGI